VCHFGAHHAIPVYLNTTYFALCSQPSSFLNHFNWFQSLNLEPCRHPLHLLSLRSRTDTIVSDAEVPLSMPLADVPVTVHNVPIIPSGLDLPSSHAFVVAELHALTDRLNSAEQLLASERVINQSYMYAFSYGYDWGKVASGAPSQPITTEEVLRGLLDTILERGTSASDMIVSVLVTISCASEATTDEANADMVRD
jgi:hypothetical protein